jgi:hypothetical protein
MVEKENRANWDATKAPEVARTARDFCGKQKMLGATCGAAFEANLGSGSEEEKPKGCHGARGQKGPPRQASRKKSTYK